MENVMTNVTGTRRVSRQVALIVTLLIAAAAYLIVEVESASANNFCSGVTLAPYGHSGDRCLATYGNYLDSTTVHDHERAGCIDVTYNGTLLQSWQCAAAENVSTLYFFGDEWKVRQPIIRNNNLSNPGVFDGTYICVLNNCA
jgi:hypothetical protein